MGDMVGGGASERDHPSKVRLGDWGDRFLAWFIDIVIVEVLVELFLAPLFYFIPRGVFMQYFGIRGSVMFLYWTLLEGNGGQSIGKMALNLKVVDIEGNDIDMEAAMIESLGKAYILVLDCLVGWLIVNYPQLSQGASSVRLGLYASSHICWFAGLTLLHPIELFKYGHL
ncbi:MAG: RDD family protein [Candidatus Asgardarchaeia archaeon]